MNAPIRAEERESGVHLPDAALAELDWGIAELVADLPAQPCDWVGLLRFMGLEEGK